MRCSISKTPTPREGGPVRTGCSSIVEKVSIVYGFGKADSPESGSVLAILIARHDNMIAEIRLVVTPTIGKAASCSAKEWLHSSAIQKYLGNVSKRLAAIGE